MNNGKKRDAQPLAAPPAAEITDIEAVGAVLAEEKLFCSTCGFELRMWPPEKIPEHVRAAHPESLWRAIAKMWADYEADTDLARRANFINKFRVGYVVTTLGERFDIYQKCVAAGAIIPPPHGATK